MPPINENNELMYFQGEKRAVAGSPHLRAICQGITDYSQMWAK